MKSQQQSIDVAQIQMNIMFYSLFYQIILIFASERNICASYLAKNLWIRQNKIKEEREEKKQKPRTEQAMISVVIYVFVHHQF